MTVTQNTEHMTASNANDIIDVAHVVAQVVTSRGEPMTLCDSIHAPKGKSIVSLPSKDLRHHLNALRHKPASEQLGFLLITASSIPGHNRLDKLNLIRDLSQSFSGYLDINWMYHDQQAAIIVEFVNQQQAQQGQQTINSTYPDIDVTNVLDMRTIINRPRSSKSHTPRYKDMNLSNPQSTSISELHVTDTAYPKFTYRLRHVPLSLKHEDIAYNLSYYGRIEQIQEVENLPSTQREILITFDQHTRINLLDHIWAVNVQGHNISVAKAHLTISQLDYRKLHVAGFHGFNYHTTESQALRVF